MIVGVPKEIKPQENRVALQPGGVIQLKRDGHEVLIEQGAGEGSGFPDHLYKEAGAAIVPDVGEVWERADMIMKVKEPIEVEYDRIREGQILFTYFHFAASEELTRAIVKSGAVAIAYETVEARDGSLPRIRRASRCGGLRSAARKPADGRCRSPRSAGNPPPRGKARA